MLTQTEARVLTTAVTTIGSAQSYGYGWLVNNTGQRIVSHSGTNNRNYAREVVYLDVGVAFLGTTNAGDPGTADVPAAAMTALINRLVVFHQIGR